MRLRNRKVTVLRAGGDQIYISAGLDEGDLVSLTTLDNSFSGALVSIQSRVPSDRLDQHGRKREAGKPPAETTASLDQRAADAADG